MVEQMESFLSLIRNSEISLCDDVIKYLQENKQDWLRTFSDPNDMVEIW